MTRTAFALLAATLLPILAAGAVGPGSVDSLEEFARAVGMKEGAWQTRVTIVAVDFKPSPTASPEDVAKIRSDIESRLGKVTQRNECLRPDDRLRLPGIVIDPVCSVSGMKAADGRWTLDSICSGPAKGESAAMRGEGTYSRAAVAGRHEGEAQFKGVVMHVKAEFESRHVGECRPEPTIHLVPAPGATNE